MKEIIEPLSLYSNQYFVLVEGSESYRLGSFTALDDIDYIGVSSYLTYTSGSSNGTTKCVEIRILDDKAFEGNQYFTVTYFTSDRSVRIRSGTFVSIVDDDG